MVGLAEQLLMLEPHWCCCPARAGHTPEAVGAVGSTAAFGITPSPTGAQHSSKANEAGAAPVPLPQGGSGGCGAAASPSRTHCPHPAAAAELCVPPWQWITTELVLQPFIFFSRINHFSINTMYTMSASIAALFVPTKADVQSRGSPLLGPAPASSPTKLSLLAIHDSAFPKMHRIFFYKDS